MSILTKQCLIGFLAAPVPRPRSTEQGATCVQVRLRLPHWRRNPGGTFTPLKDTYCTLVAFDDVAQELYGRFTKGDKIIAAGVVRTYDGDRDGHAEPREQFVAYHVGHDAVRTRYLVDRPRVQPETLGLPVAAAGR
ncbi:single-stranded DNA-binding protein [Georgenia yuyongxinii]